MQAVQATPGAIGYVEKGFADQAKLPFAQIDTGNGAVALTDDTAKTAIDGAKFAADGNDLALDLNSLYGTQEAGAYPLVLATYEIVCSKGYDADTAGAVKSFLRPRPPRVRPGCRPPAISRCRKSSTSAWSLPSTQSARCRSGRARSW